MLAFSAEVAKVALSISRWPKRVHRILVLQAIFCAVLASWPVLSLAAPMKTAADLVCTVAADDKLVHDAFSMTTDSAGRPVVSGPGYVRTLIDENNDGVYDRGVDWLRVEQGAQGLWREGNELYYVADSGLWRSVDNNGDLRGDGRPEQVLRVSTGGEHDAHAIRRGPDGYWYLSNGNFSTMHLRSLMNDKDSPVSNPKMGLIWRISPDFKTRSVWAHGLRNTYDFDFLPNGDIVTYDSDEEREMSLPAYRPSRVYALGPGCDAGWVSTAWIDNDSRFSMPLNLASLGRGSPTGVCVYQNNAIGQRYRDAVFVLDWTFGRVVAVFPDLKTGSAESPAKSYFGDSGGLCHWEVVLEPNGDGGFAPTDVCVASNGDVLVVTGGRGTAGTLYRLSKAAAAKQIAQPISIASEDKIQFTSEQETAPKDSAPKEPATESSPSPSKPAHLQFVKGGPSGEALPEQRSKALEQILLAPCPWEAWSKARWLPLISQAASEDLMAVLSGEITIQGLDESTRSAGELSMRAAQVLVYTQPLIPGKVLASGSSTEDASLAATWYALGRARINAQQSDIQAVYDRSLDSKNIEAAATTHTGWGKILGGYLARSRWEAIGLRRWACAEPSLEPEMAAPAERSLQQIAAWAYSRQANPTAGGTFIADLATVVYPPQNANSVHSDGMDRLAKAIRAGKFKSDPVEFSMALGFLQGALGDPRAVIDDSRNPDAASILDGYRGKRADVIPAALRSGWAKYCLNVADSANKLGQEGIEQEAVRTVALLRPDASDVLDRLLARVTTESHPTADINVLCAIAASNFRPTAAQNALIANAYAHVSEKISTRRLPTDNHWTLRQQQLMEALSKTDATFMTNLLGTLKQSQMKSAEWVDWLPLAQQRDAAQVVANALIKSDSSTWTTNQLQIAGRLMMPPDLANKVRMVAVKSIDTPLRPVTETTLENDRFTPALLVEFLAKTPTTADYETMLLATSASDRLVAKHGWSGLRKLPIQDANREVQAIALLAAANKTSSIDGVDVSQVSSRLRNIAGRLNAPNPPTAQAAWATWQAFLDPQLKGDRVRAAWAELLKPPAAWIEVVKSSQSITGNTNRGSVLFQRAQCNQCHNSANSIGPSLSGATRRFSYDDLFRAVYEPSRDVSDRFRASKVLTNDGTVTVGMIRTDGEEEIALVLADGTNKKIKTADIEERSESTVSIMPENLLQGWNANQLADLYEYLKGL